MTRVVVVVVAEVVVVVVVVVEVVGGGGGVGSGSIKWYQVRLRTTKSACILSSQRTPKYFDRAAEAYGFCYRCLLVCSTAMILIMLPLECCNCRIIASHFLLYCGIDVRARVPTQPQESPNRSGLSKATSIPDRPSSISQGSGHRRRNSSQAPEQHPDFLISAVSGREHCRAEAILKHALLSIYA